MAAPLSLPEDPLLAGVAREVESLGWAAALCDSRWRLVWASEELRVLMDENADEAALGYGQHIFQCWTGDTWSRTITEDSRIGSFFRNVPRFISETEGGVDTIIDILARSIVDSAGAGDTEYAQSVAGFKDFLQGVDSSEPPEVWGDVFDYLQDDLPPARITWLNIRIRDTQGTPRGTLLLYNSALRARILAMVTRGDEAMFERMNALRRPGRRRAAILFADLQQSAVLSRRLPSAAYFQLIRSLTTEIDEVVVARKGIVGKHAGDGVTAFFLADDGGSSSAAARAAIDAAREISVAAGRVAKEVGDRTGLVAPDDCLVNVGVHWGGTLYMGQLVTGGRLEVTALGDEVNECARMQQSARDGQALASKVLVEHLSESDAAALNMDLDGLLYQPIAELGGATDKALRDAGGIPVTVL